MKFKVAEMSCGHCTASIEKAFKAAVPSAKVTCNLESRIVEVRGVESAEVAASTMKAAGYDSELITQP